MVPAALLLALPLLTGCPPRVPPPDLSLDPAALLAQVQATAARLHAVQGEARVRVKAEGGASVLTFVAAARPDRLHVEALDFFGNPASVLAASEGRLAIWDSKARAFYRGRASAENVARLVPLPLAPADLVAVLCGAPPLGGVAVRATPGRGHVELEVRDGPRTTILRVVAGAEVARAEVREGGDGWEVDYGDRTRAGAVSIPDVTLRSRRAGVTVELTWNDVQPNADLDAALFRLTPRAGARVVDLDAAAEPGL